MPGFGPIEQRAMEDCFDTSVLRQEVPGMADVLDGADLFREAFVHTKGFTQGREMQFVARIDTNLMILLEQLHDAGCNCGSPLMGDGGHKAWFMKWLKGPGAAFKVRP